MRNPLDDAPISSTQPEFFYPDEVVCSMVATQLWVSRARVSPETVLEQLGAEPLGLVRLALALEETFDIVIAPESLPTFQRVQDVIDYVKTTASRSPSGRVDV